MERTNNFDALRLIAAMMVLLSHMAMYGGEKEWLFQGQTWGTVGVLMFFAISGYLVMGSWRSDPNIGRFLERRFLRLAPALVVCVPVTWLVIRVLGLEGFPNNPVKAPNGSLWTIEYEVEFYLLLLVLASMTKRPALVATLLLAFVLAEFQTFIMLNRMAFVAFLGSAFVVGMLMREYPIVFRWSWVIVGLGVATLPMHPIALSLLFAPLTIYVGTRSWPGLRSAGRYGDMSYGLYIYASPVQQIAVAYMGTEASYWLLLAVCLPAVLGLAWLSWRYVEAPALGRKPPKPMAGPAVVPATA